jgi:hypothetical protein
MNCITFLKKLNSISLSIISCVIAFIIFIISFLIVKPVYIKDISDKGIEYINYYLLISYSLLFSIIIGIIVFFIRIEFQKNNSIPDIIPNHTNYSPN